MSEGIKAPPPGIVWITGDGPELREQLSPAELERLEAFPAEKRQRDWIRGRAAAREALAQAGLECGLGEPPALEVESDRHGAPRVRCADPRWRFALSLSHGHGHALAWALPPGAGLPGVDLELKKTRTQGTFRFYMDPTERARVEALDPTPDARSYSPRDEAAIVVWALKEAAFKALLPPRGTGLLDVALELEDPAHAQRGRARVSFRGGLEARAAEVGAGRVEAGWEHRGDLVLAWVHVSAAALPGIPEPLQPQ